MDPATLVSGMQVPGYNEDRRVRDVMPGQKRSIYSAQDVADSMLTSVSGKRFRGDAVLGPLRSALPDQLARGLHVVNTGFSTTDAQTDEIITQLVFARPFPQRWEQGFVEKTALFANRTEAMFGMQNVHTIADVPTLNFLLELGDLANKQQAFAPRGNIASELVAMKERFHDLVPASAEDFSAKWNFLGPMTTFQDAGIHSSFEPTRRAQGAERMLGFSVFNRSHTFNLFGTHLKRGEQLYFVAQEVDLSYSQNFLDPHGNAVVARTSYPAHALQIRGFSEKQMPFPQHNSNEKDSADPLEQDLDYIRREHLVAQEYRPYVWKVDAKTGEGGMVQRELDAANGDIQEQIRQVPQIVYDAYMMGSVKRVGVARHTEGRAPTLAQIRDGHRSQTTMKLLQTVEIYRGL